MLDRRRALMQRRAGSTPRAPRERENAFALAGDAAAMRLGVGAHARCQPRSDAGQALPPALPCHLLRTLCALHQGAHQLATPYHARPQHRRAEPRGDVRECAMVNLRIGDQRTRQARARMIEPLARQREQCLGGRQRAHRRAQFAAAGLLAALPTGERAPRQAVEPYEEFRSHRSASARAYRQRSRSGSRRSHVRPRRSAESHSPLLRAPRSLH